jgi:hypothetical protein
MHQECGCAQSDFRHGTRTPISIWFDAKRTGLLAMIETFSLSVCPIGTKHPDILLATDTAKFQFPGRAS